MHDEFLEDKSIWVVLLSNGTMIYQDDGRPGYEEPSAWKRLGQQIDADYDLKIERMWLKFRSHVVELPEKALGYYFSKSAGAALGEDGVDQFYNVGVLEDGVIKYVCFKIPELEPFLKAERLPSEVPPQSLILNYGKRTNG